MKITKKQLRKLIQEQLKKSMLNELFGNIKNAGEAVDWVGVGNEKAKGIVAYVIDKNSDKNSSEGTSHELAILEDGVTLGSHIKISDEAMEAFSPIADTGSGTSVGDWFASDEIQYELELKGVENIDKVYYMS